MKKILLLIGLGASLLLVPLHSSAEETLMDNQLDLKTDRLNKEQTGDGQSQKITIDDRLFNTEQQTKLKDAEKVQKQQQNQKNNQLFLNEAPKTKEFDTKVLFTATEKTGDAATQKEEATSSDTSKSNHSLLPLILVAVGFTIVMVVFYQTRKRGQKNGGK